MSEREVNLKRIVKLARQGENLTGLTELDENDLKSVVKLDLLAYERNGSSKDTPVYGEVTLGELETAQAVCKKLWPDYD